MVTYKLYMQSHGCFKMSRKCCPTSIMVLVHDRFFQDDPIQNDGYEECENETTTTEDPSAKKTIEDPMFTCYKMHFINCEIHHQLLSSRNTERTDQKYIN